MISTTNIEKFFTNKIQSIEIEKDGTILKSDNKLFTLDLASNIKQFHPFFEIITDILHDDNQDFYFHTVQIDLFSKILTVDIIINSGNQTAKPAIVIFDQSEHYKDLQAITQERNEVFIRNFYEGQKLIRSEEEKVLKNIFLAEISNEFRTPISSVTALISLFQKGSLTFEQLGLINTISLSMNHLDRLVGDVFDLAISEVGHLTVQLKPFQFNNVVTTLKNLFKNRFLEKNINFEIILSPRIPKELIGDKDRLLQILTNLIENALKFTKNGQVTLKIDIDNLAVKKLGLNFLIEDTGVGISENDVTNLKKGFAKDSNNKITSLGLGLQVVNNIVKLLNGSISVDSNIGTGSTFKVYLPFDLNIKKTTIPVIKENFKKIEIIKKLNILIVDNNEINQLVLMKLLVDHGGFYMDIANNAENVKKMTAKVAYDLILVNVERPIINGFEPVIYIRQNQVQKIAKTPIIVLTSENSIEETKDIKKLKVNKYLIKPYTTDDLFLAIYKVMKLI